MAGLIRTFSTIDPLQEWIEFIIIDGGSNDSTLPFLKNEIQRRPHLHYTSEPDEGIYDAMNKGLRRATGEYVIFMNAGDRFYSETTISTLIENILEDHRDIYYGETILVDKMYNELGTRSDYTTRKLPLSLSVSSFRKGMVVCHQSFVVKRALAPLFRADNLSADLDWMITCVQRSKSCFRIPFYISSYLTGGTSQQQKIRSWVDRFGVFKRHFGVLDTIWLHLLITVRAVFLH